MITFPVIYTTFSGHPVAMIRNIGSHLDGNIIRMGSKDNSWEEYGFKIIADEDNDHILIDNKHAKDVHLEVIMDILDLDFITDEETNQDMVVIPV